MAALEEVHVQSDTDDDEHNDIDIDLQERRAHARTIREHYNNNRAFIPGNNTPPRAPPPSPLSWTDTAENKRITVSRQDRYRWYNRTMMSWMILAFGIATIIFDIVSNQRLTNITTVMLPIVTWVLGLHFDMKKMYKKKKKQQRTVERTGDGI